jgi:hypothetical protein
MSLRMELLLRTLATHNPGAITRRTLLLAPILASLPLALGLTRAEAGMIDLSETAVTLPDAIRFVTWALPCIHEMASRLFQCAA